MVNNKIDLILDLHIAHDELNSMIEKMTSHRLGISDYEIEKQASDFEKSMTTIKGLIGDCIDELEEN